MLPLLNACGGGDSGSSNTKPPSDTNINYQIDVDSTTPTDPYAGTGSFGIEKTDTAINFASGLTRGVVAEPVSYYLVYNYLIITRQLLKLPLVLNATWTEPDNGSISGWTISSVVTSLSASVSAGGSVYDNCAKITTTISGNGILSGTPATDVESEFIRGTRDVWYAPGVGVVMMQYHHENGYTTTAELQSYSLAKPSTDYFPLDVGDKWTYQWINEYRTEYVTDEYAVVRSCVGPCELPPP
jgi:hypothetical protein